MFRPVNMVWVELLLARDSAAVVVDALGEAGVIELERRAGERREPQAAEREHANRLRRVEGRLSPLARYLPPPDAGALAEADRRAPLSRVLMRIERDCEAWVDRANELVAAMAEEEAALAQWDLLEAALAALPSGAFDVAALRGAHGSGRLRPFLAWSRREDTVAALAQLPRCLVQSYAGEHDGAAGFAVVGACDAPVWPRVEGVLQGEGTQPLSVPASLAGTPPSARERLAALRRERVRSLARRRAALEALNRESGIAGNLWLVQRHLWLEGALAQTQRGPRFIEAAGWVPRHRYARLVAGLRRTGVPFLVRASAGAAQGEAPVVLVNPRWLRSFELFVRGYGMPSRNEIDPSALLAFVTPLLFGYMFGDVGQGAVLLLAGLLLRTRWPVLALLVPAGASAMTFGVLFGSVFGVEGLMAALWLHPLERPMTVLGVPLLFGALLLLLGVLLAGVEARWANDARGWWAFEFPLVLLFGAAVSVWFSPRLAIPWLVVAFGWSALAAAARERSVRAVAMALVARPLELAEKALQLAVNTLSFARVGAFALAHAGLGSAVVTLAAMSDSMGVKIAVFVLGNVLVIALEGLVVSIQTTRLVMYEFFRRFLRGEGRRFRPLTLAGHPGVA